MKMHRCLVVLKLWCRFFWFGMYVLLQDDGVARELPGEVCLAKIS
jgi:hypothetical protein